MRLAPNVRAGVGAPEAEGGDARVARVGAQLQQLTLRSRDRERWKVIPYSPSLEQEKEILG